MNMLEGEVKHLLMCLKEWASDEQVNILFILDEK